MKNPFTFMQLAVLLEEAKTDPKTFDALLTLQEEIEATDFSIPEARWLNRKNAELALHYDNLL